MMLGSFVALNMAEITTEPPRPQRHKHRKSYDVALELQTLVLKDCRDEKTKPAVRAVCARTWEILEERKRVLRNVPLPKSIDVEKQKEQRRAARAARTPHEPSMIEAPTTPAVADSTEPTKSIAAG